ERGNISEEELNSLMKRVIREELERWLIMKMIEKKGPLTVREISDETKLPKPQIIEHIIVLERLGRITTIGEKEDAYLYDLPK
ncbi:MAG: ArsR family transcriptional regulator, partial [Candidatus Jordarchaeaceae archaeon]